MTQRDLVFGVVSVLGVATLVGTSATVCAQDPQQQKGQARIVERRGPEVDLHQSARAQVVVLFPDSVGQQQTPASGDVEIRFVESEYTAPVDGSAQQGQAQTTGREILFSSRDAQNGVVSHNLDAAGNGRKLMLLARVSGENVEVRQAGGGEGVMFYTVQRPQPQTQTAQAGGGGSPSAQNSGGTPAAEGSQAGAGQAGADAQGQMDQSQSHQLQQGAQHPQQAAIIVVYTSGGQQ